MTRGSMRGQINFSRRPFRNERFPRLAYGLTAGILVVTTMAHGLVLSRYLLREREELDVKVLELETEIQETDAELARVREELLSRRNEERTEKIRFLAELYRHKSFSWTRLFNELESITPEAVRITSIDPTTNEEGIEVVLSLVGRTLADVLEMMRRLEASGLFARVLPTEEMEDEKEPGGGVVARLSIRYLAGEGEPASEPSGIEDGSEPSPASSDTPLAPQEGPS